MNRKPPGNIWGHEWQKLSRVKVCYCTQRLIYPIVSYCAPDAKSALFPKREIIRFRSHADNDPHQPIPIWQWKSASRYRPRTILYTHRISAKASASPSPHKTGAQLISLSLSRPLDPKNRNCTRAQYVYRRARGCTHLSVREPAADARCSSGSSM